MDQNRLNRTVSIKVQANDPNSILAFFRTVEKILPGVKITSGIRPTDPVPSFDKPVSVQQFRYDYFSFALVSFELTPEGNARPTQRNAVMAFKTGRR